MPDGLDGFARVKRLAAEYRALTAAYDEELLAAHYAGHGTREIIGHLREANAMGPHIRDALKRYRAAVTALATEIASKETLGERGGSNNHPK